MQPLPQVFKRWKSGAHPPLQGSTVVQQVGNDHCAADQLQAQAEQSGGQIWGMRRSAKRKKTGPLYPNAKCHRSGNDDDSMETDFDKGAEGGNEIDEVDMTLRNNPRRKKYFTKSSLRGFNPERAHRLVRAIQCV